MAAVNVTINGKNCSAQPGMTVLQAAKENGIYIPTLCNFEGLEGRANCRMCVVEIEGMRTFQPACVTAVRDGMVINTDTEALRESRKSTLELILSHHAVDCHHCLRIGSSREQNLDPTYCEMCFWCDCVRDGFCELQALAREYHVDVLPYVQKDKEYVEDRSLGSIIRNPNKCIKCGRCIEVCGAVQTVHNLSFSGRGSSMMVVPELGKPMDLSACVRCGHCVDVCPVGAIYMTEHKDQILYDAHSYTTDVVAQLSDDVLPELTELFKVEEGAITAGNVCAALHKVGIDTVISSKHAETLAVRQAEALVRDNIDNGPVIMTNSSAVMNFVGRYFPDMKDQILTYDSAQTIFGDLARAMDTENPVKTVNITSAKELGAESAETGNVDYTVNARELYRMFVRSGGAPARRTPVPFDCNWDDEDEGVQYPELLQSGKSGNWSVDAGVEEFTLAVNGKQCKGITTHTLGQVRRMLEGEWKQYDIVHLLT